MSQISRLLALLFFFYSIRTIAEPGSPVAFFGKERVLPVDCVLYVRPSTIEPGLYYRCKDGRESFSIYFTSIADSLKEAKGELTIKMTSESTKDDLHYYTYTMEAISFSEESGLRHQYARKICNEEFCVAITALENEIVDQAMKHLGL